MLNLDKKSNNKKILTFIEITYLITANKGYIT